MIIAIANQKGGVGKTTTAVNLSASLSVAEKRTLLVDFDPQGNAGSGLGIRRGPGERTIYSFIRGESTFDETVASVDTLPFLSVLPSNRTLSQASTELMKDPDNIFLLRKKLAEQKERFDYIIIDCPPSLGILTVNALTASDFVIIPMQCEYYSLEGLGQVLVTIKRIQNAANPALRLMGVLMTMYDKRLTLSDQIINQIEDYFKEKVFETRIVRTVRLAEAPSFGKPIILFDARSKGAENYLELAREIIAG
jgi:chromosome partitioning protein